MRNIVPARSLVRRSRRWLIIALILFFLGALALTVGFVMQRIPLVVPDTPRYETYLLAIDVAFGIGGVAVVAALGIGIRALTWKQDNPLALEIGEELYDFLDERYTYIRNVSKLSLGYIDAVLVGPPGVLVFRITERAGTFFNEGVYWMEQKDKGDWKTLRWSPSREAVDDIKSLREFLQARGLSEVPVYGVVVFTEEEPATLVTTENPTVPVVRPSELSYELQDSYFANTSRIDQVTVQKIMTLLYE